MSSSCYRTICNFYWAASVVRSEAPQTLHCDVFLRHHRQTLHFLGMKNSKSLFTRRSPWTQLHVQSIVKFRYCNSLRWSLVTITWGYRDQAPFEDRNPAVQASTASRDAHSLRVTSRVIVASRVIVTSKQSDSSRQSGSREQSHNPRSWAERWAPASRW